MKLIILFLFVTSTLFASIGTVVSLQGKANIDRKGDVFSIVIGDDIEKNDIITTGKNSKVKISLIDKTIISIGKESTLNIEEYVFNTSNPSESKTSINFIRGAFKTITGGIGKINPSKFKLKTKSSTIGIRGTEILVNTNTNKIACTVGVIDVSSLGVKYVVEAGEMLSQLADGSIIEGVLDDTSKVEFNKAIDPVQSKKVVEFTTKNSTIKKGTTKVKAKNGEVSVNEDGTIEYKPKEGFEGEDTVTVTTTDGDSTTTETIAISVGENEEDKPTIELELESVKNTDLLDFKETTIFENDTPTSLDDDIDSNDINENIEPSGVENDISDTPKLDNSSTSESTLDSSTIPDQVNEDSKTTSTPLVVKEPEPQVITASTPKVSGKILVASTSENLSFTVNEPEPVAGFTLDSKTGEYTFDSNDEAYAYLPAPSDSSISHYDTKKKVYSSEDSNVNALTTQTVDESATTGVKVVKIPIVVTDGTAGVVSTSLEFTVRGVNDAPILDDVTLTGLEDGTLNNRINATDPDFGETDSLRYSIKEGEIVPEGFVLSEDGTYTFDGESYDSLKEGVVNTQVIKVVVTDKHNVSIEADLTLNITGVNDAPVLDAITVDGTEDGTLGGDDYKVVATDADSGATLTYTIKPGENVPTGFVLNADGTYTFDGSSYDSLGQGSTDTQTIKVLVTDENNAVSEADLTLNITGVNDAPVLDAITVDGTEDGTLGGDDYKVVATDADSGATLTYAIKDGETVPEGFVLNADGTYTFDGSSYDSLGQGSTDTQTIKVLVTDENNAVSEADLTLNITGVNDAPVLDAITVDGTEDGTLGGDDYKVVATDADSGATLTYTIKPGENVPTGFVLNADGTYTFDGSSYDSLGQGSTDTQTIKVLVTDENNAVSEADLTLNITGVNDAPVLDAITVDGTEDGTLGGDDYKVVATDADSGATLTYTIKPGENVPTGFVLNADGTYTFDGSSYDSLGQGSTDTQTIKVLVTDENNAVSEADLTLNITGVNDAPVLDAITVDGTEDGTLGGDDYKVVATDADSGATLTYTIKPGENVPTGFVLNADGTYTFDGSSYDSLGQGSTDTQTIKVLVTDENNAVSEADLTLNITGVNDAPVLDAITVDGTEDGTLGGDDYKVVATDADSGATLTYAIKDGETVPEGFVLNADGTYTFDGSSYDSLGQGSTDTQTIKVLVTDENNAVSEADLTLNITGVNDAPVLDAITVDGTEDGTLGGDDYKVVATDADSGATLTYAIKDGETVPEGFVLNADGTDRKSVV